MLRTRWLGRVRYRDAHALQHALVAHAADDYLLLLEHPPVYTRGVRSRPEHLLVDPASVGAEYVRVDRGGDITYHGPGQLVGYPILRIPMASRAVPAHVWSVEQVVIDALGELGLPGAGRLEGLPGVWIDPDGHAPRKICAIGVRVTRGRSMHGFALNVDTDLAMFEHIVPCGIPDKAVTSLAAEGVPAGMARVVEAVTAAASRRWGGGGSETQRVAGKTQRVAREAQVVAQDSLPDERALAGRATSSLERRLASAGTDPAGGLSVRERKPPWLRVKAEMGPGFRAVRGTVKDLGLVTVCEEAGCPNIFECWADGTATFMVNGERCTRACGFCLVDTRRPGPLDAGEPDRVGAAVARMGLSHAVVTAVARDDLDDGGASAMAETVRAIRRHAPQTDVEVLIPDCKGEPAALGKIFDERPEVLNHNLETVARLQRAVRPNASYARSLAVLARAKATGLLTKSGLILGMGETPDEVRAALVDLRSVGVDIVTLGQYLRPTSAHLPVARWWRPEEFDELRAVGLAMGFAHVEASPLTRSSYHARSAAAGGRRGAGPRLVPADKVAPPTVRAL